MADKIKINSKYDMQGPYEPSDSDGEYTEREKHLLSKVRKKNKDETESEEEVYAFSGSDSDDENDITMADSDVEGQEKSDDDLPDSKAWGKDKRLYYSTDYVDKDFGGLQEGEEEVALMEEEEAKNIQKRLLEQLGDEDFSLDVFKPKKVDAGLDKEEVIKSDLTQLSKRQKRQLMEKESPEFAGLVDDFKSKLTVAKDDLKPVLNLIKDGKLPDCLASDFIRTNYDLILNYCTNISYYLILKSKRITIHNHPVVKRLFKYRQLLNQMEPIYEEVIKPQIEEIMSAVSNNIPLEFEQASNKSSKRKINQSSTSSSSSKKLKLISKLDDEDKEDTGVSDNEDEYDDDVSDDKIKDQNKSDAKEKTQIEESEESGFSDNEDDPKAKETEDAIEATDEVAEKRYITYQMSKNKGLTPHRKKEQRNPRVKHKLKYKKAKVRRKGAVREVRTEVTRYAGEISGIKSNLKKSIKIK